MDNRERLVVLLTLLLIMVVVSVVLITDLQQGVIAWHVAVEAAAALLALAGIVYLMRQSVQLRKALNKERRLTANLQQEAARWRLQSKTYLAGLSAMIDAQLSRWGLTPAEREVAFLLLKGLSLREIATLRDTTEKTAKVQAIAIYAKAGVTGRSELSAFFLEVCCRLQRIRMLPLNPLYSHLTDKHRHRSCKVTISMCLSCMV